MRTVHRCLSTVFFVLLGAVPAIAVEVELEEHSYVSGWSTWSEHGLLMVTTPDEESGTALLVVRRGDSVWTQPLDWGAIGVRWIQKPTEGSRFSEDGLYQTCGARGTGQGRTWGCVAQAISGDVLFSTTDLPNEWTRGAQGVLLTETRWWLLESQLENLSGPLVVTVRTGSFESEPSDAESWTWRVQNPEREHVTFEHPQMAVGPDSAFLLAGGQLARFEPGRRSFERRPRAAVDQLHAGPGPNAWVTVEGGRGVALLARDLEPRGARPAPPENSTPGFHLEKILDEGRGILRVEPGDGAAMLDFE